MGKRTYLFRRVGRTAGIGLIVWGLFCCLATTAVFAAPALPEHATVISAVPAIGSTITSVPTQVTVTTVEDINPDPSKSNLFVYGPGGEATDTLISQGNAQVPLSSPKQMSVRITPNSGHLDGVYVVLWKTVSADDGDPASGSFTFTVNTHGLASTPTTTTQQSATTILRDPRDSSASGIPLWVPIVASFATLLIGLGAGLGLGRAGQKAALSSSSIGALRRQMKRDDE